MYSFCVSSGWTHMNKLENKKKKERQNFITSVTDIGQVLF